jgi:hypothetical protein
MRVEKYAYINGSRKNQLEIVDFLYNDKVTGFGPYYTKSVRRKIEHIRANVRYMNKQYSGHCISVCM